MKGWGREEGREWRERESEGAWVHHQTKLQSVLQSSITPSLLHLPLSYRPSWFRVARVPQGPRRCGSRGRLGGWLSQAPRKELKLIDGLMFSCSKKRFIFPSQGWGIRNGYVENKPHLKHEALTKPRKNNRLYKRCDYNMFSAVNRMCTAIMMHPLNSDSAQMRSRGGGRKVCVWESVGGAACEGSDSQPPQQEVNG